jgi:hypothetical protein
MRFARMTTRRWKIAAAVVGAAVWTYRLRERQSICREAIEFHAQSEEADLSIADSPSNAVCGTFLLSSTTAERRRFLRLLPTPAQHRARCIRDAAYHARVRQKFERAAWWKAAFALSVRDSVVSSLMASIPDALPNLVKL